VDTAQPVPVLLALHGYAGSGAAISARLRPCADQYGWVLVAPTMAYRDYFDPHQLRVDAEQNLPQVHALLDQVRAGVSGLDLEPRLIVYGFSRGAQMAERFSTVYPGEVAGVAALSGGSYTLPELHDTDEHAYDFPFGVSDLSDLGFQPFDMAQFEQIPFWLGVGSDDVNPSDTSRSWDGIEGATRVQRAETFVAAVQSLGGSAELHVFAHVGHDETAVMRQAACGFLHSVSVTAMPEQKAPRV
jgi:predicted esterase